MPWTESRSRDEWLAEVQRRGHRLRRRRRWATSFAGSVAIVLPLTVAVTLLARESNRPIELTVAGPPTTTPPTGVDTAAPGFSAGATSETPSVSTAPFTTSTVARGERLPTVGGSQAPASPDSSPTDDPVVRSTTTTTLASVVGAGPVLGPATAAASPNSASATTVPAPPSCLASDFKLTLTLERTTYRSGETVKAESTLEKRSPAPCAAPSWTVEFSILNSAGKDVFEDTWTRTEVHHADPYPPDGQGGVIYAGPGIVRTDSFGWDDCTKPPPGPVVPAPGTAPECVRFPTGTYTVVAAWTGTGSGPPARTTFQLGA